MYSVVKSEYLRFFILNYIFFDGEVGVNALIPD